MRILLLLAVISSAHAQDIEKAKKLFEQKKADDALRIFSSVNESSKDFAEARYYMGRIAFDKKNYEDAMDLFEEAVDANDKVADYHYWYGSAMGTVAEDANTFRQGILAPKIKDEFEKTVALDPKKIEAQWGLVEFYTKAHGFMGGDWAKAKESARAIGKIKKAEGYRALGVVAERQEELDEAEKNFVLAIREDPQYIYNLSNFYIRRKNYDKAFTLFEDLLKKNPDDMASAYQVGKIAALTGRKLEEGEKYLVKYLAYQPKQNEPSHAGANMRLAQIKEKNGNKVEAKKLFELALKLDPNLKEAKEGLERLGKV